MSNKHTLASIARIVVVATILMSAIFALTTPTASAAGITSLIVYAPKAQTAVYDKPGGTPIFMDYVTGDVSADMFSVVGDEIWLRLGDGTQALHPPVGEAERWVRYGATRDAADHDYLPALINVYRLPKVSWSKDQIVGRDGKVYPTLLRVVEEPVEYTLADGSSQYVSMTGDLGAKPEYLLDLHFPLDRTADLRLYADWANTDCTARLNGGEQVITNTQDSMVYNGVFKVVSGTCAIFSTADQGVTVTGVKRSFSAVYVQSSFGGYAVAFAGLLAIALAAFIIWRKRRLAKAVAAIAIVLVLATMLTAPVFAGPGGPGTQTPTPTPTETATVEATTEVVTDAVEFLVFDDGNLYYRLSKDADWILAGYVRGDKGDHGVNCFDPVGDRNGDGALTADDCLGQNGADGAPGLQGPEGQVGPQGPQGLAGKDVEPIMVLGLFGFNFLNFIVMLVVVIYVWRHKHEDSPAFKTEK